MMQIKNRIPRAHKRIITRIAADGEMPVTVQAIRGFKSMGESFEVVVNADQFLDVCGSRAVGENGGDVALEATGVVVFPATVADARLEGCGAEVHGVILEWSTGDAATAGAGWDGEVAAREGEGEGSIVGDGFAVAAHGVD